MNLPLLEKIARQAINGGDVTEKSNAMLKRGFITPAEHRSITSLSWQIAANVRANGSGTATLYAKDDYTERFWV